MFPNPVGGNLPRYNYTHPVDLASVGRVDPILLALVETAAFRRLQEVRFLGGIDYLIVRVPNGVKSRYTRYQHSLGVARLANYYAKATALPSSERLLACTAALLHDIGHAPLSHSLEPVFLEYFGIEHHQATIDIITGKAAIGREVVDVLRSAKIDIERLLAVISGEDNSFHGFFSGPINFDTIEGILRSQSYAGPDTLPNPEAVTEAAIQRNGANSRRIVDDFWSYKDQVYRTVINSHSGVLADFACQLHMRRQIDLFSPDDYYSTEEHVFRKLPGLRPMLTDRYFEALIHQEIRDPIHYQARRFFIDQDGDFFRCEDHLRYRQTKEARTLLPRPLGSLYTDGVKRDLFDDSL